MNWRRGLQIKYLPQAGENLRDIRKYYLDVGGKPLALKRVERIRAELAALTDNPAFAPPYEFAPGVRRLAMADGAFLAFYRVREFIEVIHLRRAECEPVTTNADS